MKVEERVAESKAAEALLSFKEAWCRVNSSHKLEFRCSRCPFRDENGTCSVHIFINKHESNIEQHTLMTLIQELLIEIRDLIRLERKA